MKKKKVENFLEWQNKRTVSIKRKNEFVQKTNDGDDFELDGSVGAKVKGISVKKMPAAEENIMIKKTGKLRNFFIPHAGNGYKPHALHPKRVFFHAVSAVAVKVLVAAFVLAFPVEAWLTPDILSEQSKKIIALTNQVRQGAGVSLLAESEALTRAAYAKVEDMLFYQYFAHAGPDGKRLRDWILGQGYGYSTAGENLAMGFASAEEVVNGWTRSKTHYANLIDPEFEEIGVGMASGMYKNYDTTFVAQYFARPVGDVAGEKDASAETSGVIVDQEKTSLIISEPAGQNVKIVKADVYIEGVVKQAEITFNNYRLPLTQDNAEEGRWTGESMIFSEGEEQIFNPVVLATLSVKDAFDRDITSDINWDNIHPDKPSLLNQYFFLKSSPSKSLQPLFDISSGYYRLLMFAAFFALLLNVFIETRKQHPHVIASATGLIALMVILLIF